VEYAVAAQYARDMFTTPEFIMGMKSYDRSHAEWAAYIANETSSAIKLRVPFGQIEKMPRMRREARIARPPDIQQKSHEAPAAPSMPQRSDPKPAAEPPSPKDFEIKPGKKW